LVHQGRCITKQFTVEFVTAKQARYSSQQIAAAELIIAKAVCLYNCAFNLWAAHALRI
jgi:hypothetical protein